MDKPNLILLHGALGASHQLQPLAKLLENRFQVFLCDFSGHGGKPFNPRGFTIDVFVDELRDYIHAKNISNPYIFGYSMGGYVAIKLAIKFPGLVSAIFTLATKFEWTPESAEREMRQLNPDKIEEKVPKFAKALELRHQPNNWKKVLAQTAELMYDLGNNSALTQKDLAMLACPVELGIGTEDIMVGQKETEWAANAIPQSGLKVFEGFKHPIEQVDIEKLATEITSRLPINSVL